MDSKEAINELMTQYPAFKKLGAGAYKPGLEATLDLAARFGNPQDRLRTVHVAGTNGKGTTASLIAAALQAAGYKTGLYTSPHLTDFLERIRVDGRMIDGEAIADFMERYHAGRPAGDFRPSFFELTTVMALEYFAREGVDVAVVEVGLGGRLDSTNIVRPDLCVITNISMDHTQILGDTPAKIAAEKAGIIKEGVPVVVGEAAGEVREVFEHTARGKGAPIIFAEDSDTTAASGEERISVDRSPFGAFATELHGAYQATNARTALTALAELRRTGYHIGDEAVRTAFARICDTLHGRWQMHDGVLCDPGHNEAAWRHTSRYLAAHPGMTAILGFCADKDLGAIVGMLPAGVHYYCVAADTPRAMPADELARMMCGRGLEATAFGSVRQAVTAAKKEAAGPIFLGGSFFVVAEYL